MLTLQGRGQIIDHEDTLAALEVSLLLLNMLLHPVRGLLLLVRLHGRIIEVLMQHAIHHHLILYVLLQLLIQLLRTILFVVTLVLLDQHWLLLSVDAHVCISPDLLGRRPVQPLL